MKNSLVLALFAALLQTACMTPHVARPLVPGHGVEVADVKGFKISAAKHTYLVLQGVPTSYFSPYPDKDYPFYLSEENENYVYLILQKDRNP